MAGFLAHGLASQVTCQAFSHLPEAIPAIQKRTIRRFLEASTRFIAPPLQWLPLPSGQSVTTNHLSVYENTNPLYSRGVGCDQSARIGSTLRIPILILQASPFGTIRNVIDRPIVLSLSIVIAPHTGITATRWPATQMHQTAMLL